MNTKVRTSILFDSETGATRTVQRLGLLQKVTVVGSITGKKSNRKVQRRIRKESGKARGELRERAENGCTEAPKPENSKAEA